MPKWESPKRYSAKGSLLLENSQGPKMRKKKKKEKRKGSKKEREREKKGNVQPKSIKKQQPSRYKLQ